MTDAWPNDDRYTIRARELIRALEDEHTKFFAGDSMQTPSAPSQVRAWREAPSLVDNARSRDQALRWVRDTLARIENGEEDL